MPVLLFLHGWGGDSQSFTTAVKYFRHQYRVLVPVFSCPPAEQVYTLDNYVDDLQTYLHVQGVTHCVVVAHSFGARLVALLNQRQPELFSKIIITGGAGLRPRFNFVIWLKICFYKLRKRLFGVTRGGSADYRQLTPVGKATFRNIINQDLSAEFAQIKVPTLLIYGNRDAATPLYMYRRLLKLIPQAVGKIYRGHSHWAYLTNSERFINDVAEFLT